MATTPTAPKAPEPIRNPNPRQRFQTSPASLREHHDLVDRPAFERGCDFAMLQYQHQLSLRTTDGVTASMAGMKLQGVIEFLAIFRTLADTALPNQRRPDDNLTH